MRAVGLVLVVGWIAFWAYWLFSARNTKPGQTRWRRFAGVRVAAIILIVYFVRFGGFNHHGGIKENWALGGIGLALWIAGLGLAVWARIYIGRNWGMPMTRKENPDLVTSGPYRLIRHPIYTGIIGGMIGTALATAFVGFIAVAILAVYFVYSAVNEERYMTEQFPADYPAYKARSKMLIPFIF